MGKRGPAAKPTALKLLEGNPGKRCINQSEPKYNLSEKGRKPPPWLGKHAKAEWKRIFPLLEKNGLVTDADYMTLCAYCQNVDTWICAEKQKRVEGITTTTSNGCEIQHPAVGIANTAMTNMLKFGREFGLTPSSRSDLSAEKFENADNPLLSLMKRAGQS